MDYPFEQQHRHFSSGVNNPGEVAGIMGAGSWVGIAASEVRPGLLEELEARAGGPACPRPGGESGGHPRAAHPLR